jgi:hypothetical protein
MLWGEELACLRPCRASGLAATSDGPTSIDAGAPAGERSALAVHGGLLPPFADALLGQDLAQPGMLVVHVPSPDWVVSSIAA